MSRFNELNENLMVVMQRLLENQNLCRLLTYNVYTPLAQPAVANPNSLLFKNIYPFPFIPDIQTEACSILNVQFDNFTLSHANPYYKTNQLTFIVLCHADVWRIQGMLRPFAIMKEIDEIFNGQLVIGMGKLNFESGMLTWANEKYSGYKVSYRVFDFN